MDRNELKSQALLEKISTLTTQYENQIADLRVEITLTSEDLRVVSQERDQLQAQIEQLKSGYVEETENSDKS